MDILIICLLTFIASAIFFYAVGGKELSKQEQKNKSCIHTSSYIVQHRYIAQLEKEIQQLKSFTYWQQREYHIRHLENQVSRLNRENETLRRKCDKLLLVNNDYSDPVEFYDNMRPVRGQNKIIIVNQ